MLDHVRHPSLLLHELEARGIAGRRLGLLQPELARKAVQDAAQVVLLLVRQFVRLLQDRVARERGHRHTVRQHVLRLGTAMGDDDVRPMTPRQRRRVTDDRRDHAVAAHRNEYLAQHGPPSAPLTPCRRRGFVPEASRQSLPRREVSPQSQRRQ